MDVRRVQGGSVTVNIPADGLLIADASQWQPLFIPGISAAQQVTESVAFAPSLNPSVLAERKVREGIPNQVNGAVVCDFLLGAEFVARYDLAKLMAIADADLEISVADPLGAYQGISIVFGNELSAPGQRMIGWEDAVLTPRGRLHVFPFNAPSTVAGPYEPIRRVAFVATQKGTALGTEPIRFGSLRLRRADARPKSGYPTTWTSSAIGAAPIDLLPGVGQTFGREIEVFNYGANVLRVGVAGTVSPTQGIRVWPNEKSPRIPCRNSRLLQVCAEAGVTDAEFFMYV